MAEVKIDKSRVIMEVDGKQAISELGKLEMQAKQLRIDMGRAKIGTNEYIAANEKLSLVEADIKRVRGELGLTGMTMSQLIKYQRDLAREMNTTVTKGTERYNELQREIAEVNATINQQKAELRGAEQGFSKMNTTLGTSKGFFSDIQRELKVMAVTMIGLAGIMAAFTAFQGLIDGSAKLSDAFADVQKTTGLTNEEVESLSRQLKKIDTRSSRSELLSLAAVAGKLGINGKQNLIDFADGADKINVALGEDLGDDAIKNIGKLNELFGIRTAFGYRDSMIKTGSAINELGASSTASEGYLVNFAKRLGGAGANANIALTDILGLAATLDSLGQQAETSSTAVGTFLVDMFKDTATYANIAGMSLADFTKLMNTDANEALVRTFEGLQGNNEGLTLMVKKLNDAGVEGARGIQVISTLANNTKLLREQQDIANKSFTEGTSIINEFNLKNNNFAGNLAKLQKALAGIFINPQVMMGLNNIVEGLARWIKIPLSETLTKQRESLQKLHIQILSSNTSNEQRIKLINTLKGIYPELLGSINAETVSNKQLGLAIKAVNDQLINKIIIEAKQEEIDDKIRAAANAKLRLLMDEERVTKNMVTVSEKYNLKVFEGLSLEDQARTLLQRSLAFGDKKKDQYGQLTGEIGALNKAIISYQYSLAATNALDKDALFLQEEKQKLMQKLNITSDTPPEITPVPEGGNFDDEDSFQADFTPNTSKALDQAADDLDKLKNLYSQFKSNLIKIQDEYTLSSFGQQEQEEIRVKAKYGLLITELKGYLTSKVIGEKEHTEKLKEVENLRQQELDAIKFRYEEAYKEKKAEAEKTITEATLSERELAELKINQHYDNLLAIAREFGIEEYAIHEARRASLDTLNKKYQAKELADETSKFEAKKAMALTFGETAVSLMGMVNSFSKDSKEFEKSMAIGNAAIKSGEAIANIIAAFSSTSITPIDLAIKVAAGVGIIATNISNAVRAVKSANLPEPPETPNATSTTAVARRGQIGVRKSFFYGGKTGEGMGFGDEHGEFAGYVHKREYVIPEIVTSDPWVANVLPIIESIRQEKIKGFAMGGPTSTIQIGQAPNLSNEKLEKLMEIMITKLDSIPKELKAYLVYSELEKFQDESNSLKTRYRS